MITQIALDNGITLDPIAPFTALVGSNGSGKTDTLLKVAGHASAKGLYARVFRFNYPDFVDPEDSDSDILLGWGSGLAGQMCKNQDALRGYLARVLPNWGFLMQEDRGYFSLWFDTPKGNRVHSTRVGSGVLMVCAILTALHEDLNVICIDDIGHHLHPKTQQRLVPVMREIAEAKGCQVIVSTHSPYIVDGFKPEEVWVMDRRERLSNFGHANNLFTPSEIWMALD